MEEAIGERKRGMGMGASQLRKGGATYCYKIFIAKCVYMCVGSFV